MSYMNLITNQFTFCMSVLRGAKMIRKRNERLTSATLDCRDTPLWMPWAGCVTYGLTNQKTGTLLPSLFVLLITQSVFLQGAAAVLFMQLCRRIHSRFSSHADQNPGPARIRDVGLVGKCSYKVLIDIRESCCQSQSHVSATKTLTLVTLYVHTYIFTHIYII